MLLKLKCAFLVRSTLKDAGGPFLTRTLPFDDDATAAAEYDDDEEDDEEMDEAFCCFDLRGFVICAQPPRIRVTFPLGS